MAESQTKSQPTEDNTFPQNVVVLNQDVVKPRPFAYRVGGTAGYHEQDEVIRAPDGKLQFDPVLDNGQPRKDGGKPVVRIRTRAVKYGPRREAGDIFHTHVEYDKVRGEDGKPVHNPTGYPPKYIRLDAAHDPHAEELSAVNRKAVAQAEQMQKMLRNMNVEQLRLYAEQEGIDVGRATTTKQFIERIEAAWDTRELAAA